VEHDIARLEDIEELEGKERTFDIIPFAVRWSCHLILHQC